MYFFSQPILDMFNLNMKCWRRGRGGGGGGGGEREGKINAIIKMQFEQHSSRGFLRPWS
jgi:hypothetical protein